MIKQIDADLTEKLRIAWEAGASTPDILDIIRKELGASVAERLKWEHVLLFGRFRETECKEVLVGQLFAVAPGIVILDADSYDRDMSGIVRRSTHGASLFTSESFRGATWAHLIIYPSTFPKNQPRYETYPVWMALEFGGNDGTRQGIDPGRWAVLEPWFDKWLPVA
jgi:hypothetical protein